MEYLSLSRRREIIGISSHWGNGSGTRLRRLEWNRDKKTAKLSITRTYIASISRLSPSFRGSKVMQILV